MNTLNLCRSEYMPKIQLQLHLGFLQVYVIYSVYSLHTENKQTLHSDRVHQVKAH